MKLINVFKREEIIVRLLLLHIILFCMIADAQAFPNAGKDQRVVIIVDGSVSMANHWLDGKSRYNEAQTLISQLQEGMYLRDETIEFSLWLYGHQYLVSDKKCKDARREVAFSKDNLTQISLRLNDVAPRGNGSMNYAIDEVLKSEIADTQRYQYSVIVITDSSKNCGNGYCMPANENLYASLYKRYLISLAGERQTNCFDKVFSAIDKESVDAAIKWIAGSFPQRKKVQIKYEVSKTPPANRKKALPESVTPVKQVSIKQPVPNLDTIPSTKQEAAVSVRKNSRIKADTDEYGYVNLINIRNIGVIVIYSESKGEYKRVDEVFPIGLNIQKVQLKKGNYKAVCVIGGYDVTQSFNITTDNVTDVWIQ